MTEDDGFNESRPSSSKGTVRTVLEAAIVLLLGWVGNTLLSVRTDNAVIQAQLLEIKSTLSYVPTMKEDLIRTKIEVERLREDVSDLKRKHKEEVAAGLR